MTFDTAFKKLFDSTMILNPFSTKFRYPSEFDIPDYNDAKNAVKHAQKIFDFVIKKILEPNSGQTLIFQK